MQFTLVAITILFITFFILLSTTLIFRSRQKFFTTSLLTLLYSLLAYSMTYSLQLLSYDTILGESFFLIKLSIIPFIASAILIFSFSKFENEKISNILNKSSLLISSFLFGVIVTNSLHGQAFNIDIFNIERFDYFYTSCLFLKLTHLYLYACFGIGFITLVYLTFKKSYKMTIFALVGFLIPTIMYTTSVLVPEIHFEPFGISVLILLVYIYFVLVKYNNYKFFPVVKEEIFEILTDGVLILDSDFKIKDFNLSLTKIFPVIAFNESINKKLKDTFSQYPELIQGIQNQKNTSLEINSKKYLIETYTLNPKNRKNKIYNVYFKDADNYIENLKETDNITTLDYLTQLKSKNYFLDIAEYEVAKAQRYEIPFTLIYININNFKKINEEYGHIAGNVALISIANIMKKEIRKSDILARFEMDHFVLILTNTHIRYGELVAERIRKKIANSIIEFDNSKFHVTVNIGGIGSGNATTKNITYYIQEAANACKQAEKNAINSTYINVD